MTQREQAKQAARIVIQASASQPDANGDYTIRIQTNADTSSFKIDGQEMGGSADGNYNINRVARLGQETRLTLAARDVYGNTDIKTLLVARPVATAVESIAPLNVANLRTQPAKDAVAIIIGIQDYKRLPRAEFANEDARAFNEYARRGLGIRPDNIKMLLDAEATACHRMTANCICCHTALTKTCSKRPLWAKKSWLLRCKRPSQNRSPCLLTAATADRPAVAKPWRYLRGR